MSMELLDAVHTALTQTGAPPPHREISRRFLDANLWQSSGKTPGATIHARLAVDIKKKGKNSRFVRTAPGVFAWGRNWIQVGVMENGD